MVHADIFMLACALFNEQNKGPIFLSIITWFVLRKQNVQAKNSAQRNTKKSTKYAGAIFARSPWEIIWRVIKYINPFPGLLVHGKIMLLAERFVVKISQLPSKLRFLAYSSFFGQSLSRGHYPPIHQPPKGFYFLIIQCVFNNRPNRLTQCCAQFKSPGIKILCFICIRMWHSHLNDMEIYEREGFFPKGFELGTTLS